MHRLSKPRSSSTHLPFSLSLFFVSLNFPHSQKFLLPTFMGITLTPYRSTNSTPAPVLHVPETSPPSFLIFYLSSTSSLSRFSFNLFPSPQFIIPFSPPACLRGSASLHTRKHTLRGRSSRFGTRHSFICHRTTGTGWIVPGKRAFVRDALSKSAGPADPSFEVRIISASIRAAIASLAG